MPQARAHFIVSKDKKKFVILVEMGFIDLN